MSRAYPLHPRVGVGIVVLRRDPAAVLLIRRGQPPNAGAWALPGGGQELGETMERTARRELMEECGILTGPLLLAGVVDSIHTDALGRVQFHYAIVDYATLWTGQAPVAGSDAEAVAWAELDDLSRYALWSEALRIISLARGLLSL